MAFIAKTYANKKAVDGKPNRVNVMMSVDEAQAIADKDKAAVAELFKAITEAVKN